MRLFTHSLTLLAGLLVLAAGCSQVADSPLSDSAKPSNPTSATAEARAPEGEHGHKPGSHGGSIVEIGRDSYHAEAVFGPAGSVRVYLLGQDEGRVQEVEVQTLAGFVKPAGAVEASELPLSAAPQPGDSAGKTSLFVGTLPEALRGKPVEVTVPSIRIAGERFRFGFRNTAAPVTHAQQDMPAELPDEEARQLYLTPGGKYTALDIQRNGGVTAAEKFKGKMSVHDMSPKPGDRLCPITATKANPTFTWVVDGQEYQFCCPPCVDEFVRQAKESPGEVQPASSYIKK